MRPRASLAALAPLAIALLATGCADPLSPESLEGRWGLAHVAGEPLPFTPPPDLALGLTLLGDTLSFASGGAGTRVTTWQETVAGVGHLRIDSTVFSWRLSGREVVVRPFPCPPDMLCAAAAASIRFTLVGGYLARFEDGIGTFAYESAGSPVLPLVR